MVECESNIADTKRERGELVLIDTWWNVNNIHAYIVNRLSVVLIDTWWNVNPIASTHDIILNTVLIDTWWNVNISLRSDL